MFETRRPATPERKGYFVEFTIEGRTQFSSVVEPSSKEMFMTIWRAAGERVFAKLTDEDEHVKRHGEFRISPLMP